MTASGFRFPSKRTGMSCIAANLGGCSATDGFGGTGRYNGGVQWGQEGAADHHGTHPNSGCITQLMVGYHQWAAVFEINPTSLAP